MTGAYATAWVPAAALESPHMLTVYDVSGNALAHRHDTLPPLEPATVWLDLLNPTPDEEHHVETLLGIDIPTRDEVKEIEASSRLFQRDGAHFMTAMLVTKLDSPWPVTSYVTFVLTKDKLVTVRYSEPFSFFMYAKRAMAGEVECATAPAVLTGLLEQIIDRVADLIERMQGDIDKLSETVFSSDDKRPRDGARDVVLKTVGKQGDLTTRARESLLSLSRLLGYFTAACEGRADDKRLRARLDTATRDVNSLSDHLNYLNGQITFLLDATLGFINIDQNRIIKIISVVSLVFTPPTLIASIYGMNFHWIPELSLDYGYIYALLFMVLTAVLPLWYFRSKGWL